MSFYLAHPKTCKLGFCMSRQNLSSFLLLTFNKILQNFLHLFSCKTFLSIVTNVDDGLGSDRTKLPRSNRFAKQLTNLSNFSLLLTNVNNQS